MAFQIPGVGEEQERSSQQWGVGSHVFRGIVSEIVSLDFQVFIEGTVGNLLGISRGLFLASIFLGLLGVLWYLIPNLPLFAFAWIVGTMPIWVPVAAVAGGWKAWVWYVQSNFLSNRTPLLLEVKMPRELMKSPRGMEVALSLLWVYHGETTFFHRKWLGQVRPIFSFEMASFGGDVHFYIWLWKEWRPVIEAAIYAQYPEVELVEVEDYASKYIYDPGEHKVYATDFRYEPRNDAYPIKTYVEFEIDKDPKEEYKVDPLAQIVERLSTLGPKEQIWLQIVITMDMEVRRKPGGKFWELEGRYTGLVKAEIDKIRKDLVGDPNDPKDRWKSFSRVQMYRINEQIRTMERNMSKHPYHVGIRGVFISDEENFTGRGWNSMRWIWTPMGNPQYLNQLRPRRWHTPFDYPYQDVWDLRWNLHARRFFDCYRRRAHFYAPFTLPDNLMSTEVIATLWHPISTAIKSPGVERIPAKKAQPPPNLPK
ncbi:hypothetical protein A3B35_02860 [Candidatus Kaiserbacteria bacterium RIFCSPLOWO2_01_FULL_54_24]|uniref:Uncharacterized protein n=1 Tax=Candidatus Kaiserbacteria bacterium RIFCSPLOWO2_01_FULL_54_24 TaxID=1798515 RepID=A0A1F6EUB9_9BACT|nr:MAG: hypothetical protein A3B35_02860 [Candidatus Kaiserbacteria bacterium RIFCSPLOWO2_01_FULL_54_24]